MYLQKWFYLMWMVNAAYCWNALGRNFALQKPAVQSSTLNQAYAKAKNAVDGRSFTDYIKGSCSITNYDNRAWWAVDLLTPVTVSAVTITNRGDCCGERLHDFDILVGDSLNMALNDGTICAHTPGRVADGATVTFRCAEPFPRGHIVKIQLRGKDYLQLCEVQVFGTTDSHKSSLC